MSSGDEPRPRPRKSWLNFERGYHLPNNLLFHKPKKPGTQLSSVKYSEEMSLTSSLPLNVLILLFDTIAGHVPILDVMALSQTHRMLMDKRPAHLCQSFDALLTSRISKCNVSGFRTLLLKTRAAISGSTALHFVLRENHWQPYDFDIYAPFGTGYAVVHWLMAHEAYRIVSDGSKSFIPHPHTISVPADRDCDWLTDLASAPASDRNLRKAKNRYGSTDSHIYRVYKLCSTNNTFIDVIESSQPSFLSPITKFHSTLVMNYLTPESIVVLYPKLTFKRKGILQYRGKDTLEAYDPEAEPAADVEGVGRNQDYVTKYKSRGFTLYSRPADLSRSCGAACPAMPRTVSRDADEWALHLKIGDPSSSFRTDGSGSRYPPNPITPAASPSISGTQTGEASGSQQSRSSGSWASSYVTDLATEFSDLQIETDHETENGHETRRETMPDARVTTMTTITTSRGLNCTRPPVPETHWAFEAPPLINEITSRLRRRARGVCRNPYCPRSRMRVSTFNA